MYLHDNRSDFSAACLLGCKLYQLWLYMAQIVQHYSMDTAVPITFRGGCLVPTLNPQDSCSPLSCVFLILPAAYSLQNGCRVM